MASTHVRVRVPSAGTAAGDFMQAHPEGRMACVETARWHGPQGLVIDHFALVDGVRDGAIGELLSAWHREYGVAGEPALGTLLALRLPLPVSRLQPLVVARLKALDLVAGASASHVLNGPHCDLWIDCGTAAAADAMADAARLQLPSGVGAVVTVGEPPVADQECWAALRLAAEVGPVAARPGHPL